VEASGLWGNRQDLPITSPARVAVVLHLHYRDLLEEILDQLSAIPVSYDLIVTNSSGESLTIDAATLPGAAHIVVLDVENHGRDILPLVSLVNTGLLRPYHLVLKVHTKKSVWRAAHADLPGSGEEWRKQLLSELLGSEANVRTILEAFATGPDLGLITSDGSVLGPDFWGDNQAVAAMLLRRLELDLRPDKLRFDFRHDAPLTPEQVASILRHAIDDPERGRGQREDGGDSDIEDDRYEEAVEIVRRLHAGGASTVIVDKFETEGRLRRVFVTSRAPRRSYSGRPCGR